MQLTAGHLYEFGPFVLDTNRHLLLLQGRPVPLTPKTYDLLVVLVENSGRVILKDELMKMVWVDSFVEDSNLTQQISAVRKALGETAGEDRYIVTVPGKGYRFAAAVTEPVVKEHTQPVARRMGRVATAGGVAAIAILVGLGYSILRRPAQEGPRSLAILPFQSLKGDRESDFLGFSLADAVITKLGGVRSLTVRPSSAVEQYRHQAVDFRQAAAELHVDTLLTGNFLRDGEDLRITSQLIDVKTQNILWKGAFDLKYDKLLTVQDSVAQQIVKGLQLSLSPREVESLRPEKPVDPMAYEYYLRGVDLYAQNEFPMAIKMLRRSAGIDPGYSPDVGALRQVAYGECVVRVRRARGVPRGAGGV